MRGLVYTVTGRLITVQGYKEDLCVLDGWHMNDYYGQPRVAFQRGEMAVVNLFVRREKVQAVVDSIRALNLLRQLDGDEAETESG